MVLGESLALISFVSLHGCLVKPSVLALTKRDKLGEVAGPPVLGLTRHPCNNTKEIRARDSPKTI